MTILVWLSAVAVAASLPLLWWATAGARRPTHAVSRNLTGGRASVADVREAVLSRSATDRAIRPLLHSAAAAARRLTPTGFLASLERRLVLAGQQATWPIERVLAVKLLLAFGTTGLGILYFLGEPGLRWAILTVLLGTAGFFVPDVVLWSRAKERQQTIERELPDTLDQMTISVESGLGFESALARAGRSGTGPLAAELVRTLQEIQVGVDRKAALRRLADRTTVRDLRQFVVSVLQAEQHGIPIARVLRVQADELRTKRSQRAEEAAMKLPVKILFPLIFCILPALFVVILGPAGIRISDAMFGPGGLGG